MIDRAEGYWWVRVSRGWAVMEVDAGAAFSTTGVRFELSDSDILEWGPYLGKEPGDVLMDGVACPECGGG